MINPQQDIASFTMRFVQQRWKNQVGEPKLQWRGKIRHVQSDDEMAFTDFSNALNFIQTHLMNLTAKTTSDSSDVDQSVYFRESYRLWESFLSNYSNMFLSTMENAVRQSENIQSQFEKATNQTLNTIKAPSIQDYNELLSQLQNMQSEIQKLQSEIGLIEKRLEERNE